MIKSKLGMDLFQNFRQTQFLFKTSKLAMYDVASEVQATNPKSSDHEDNMPEDEVEGLSHGEIDDASEGAMRDISEDEEAKGEDEEDIAESELCRKLKEASESLKEDILAAIEPYKNSDAKLDLTTIEVAVMAVLCMYGERFYIDETHVARWMVKTFPSYMDLAVLAFCSEDEAAPSFQKLFKQEHWDTCQDVINQDWDCPLQEHDNLGDRDLYVDPYEGRIFLRGFLGPKRTGEFQFLKLPAEIRVAIYEYVFTFLSSGLGFRVFVDPSCRSSRGNPKSDERLLIQRAERGDEKNANTQQWACAQRIGKPPHIRRRFLHTNSMNSILALLSANRQIYEEAMPYFYRCNHFYASSGLQLRKMLAGCGVRRRKHFTSIAFTYDFSDYCYAPGHRDIENLIACACFDMLGEVKNLRFLQIEAESWMIRRGESDGPPGLDTLRMVKVEKLELAGACAGLERYLREEMTKPRVPKDVVLMDHEETDEEGARPKKKAEYSHSGLEADASDPTLCD